MDSLGTSGSMPVLEKLLSFAAQRQKIIAHNIANISTPNFQQMDVSVKDFQSAMAAAINRRRGETGGQSGDLNLDETNELQVDESGRLILRPTSAGEGALAHDRNNRDLETLMKDLVENASTYRLASDLLRSRMMMLTSAISERV